MKPGEFAKYAHEKVAGKLPRMRPPKTNVERILGRAKPAPTGGAGYDNLEGMIERGIKQRRASFEAGGGVTAMRERQLRQATETARLKLNTRFNKDTPAVIHWQAGQ